jgi:hypothetical protein
VGAAPNIINNRKIIGIKKGELGGDLNNIYIERFQS